MFMCAYIHPYMYVCVCVSIPICRHVHTCTYASQVSSLKGLKSKDQSSNKQTQLPDLGPTEKNQGFQEKGLIPGLGQGSLVPKKIGCVWHPPLALLFKSYEAVHGFFCLLLTWFSVKLSGWLGADPRDSEELPPTPNCRLCFSCVPANTP